ncbi:hypothetical protein EON83_18895 [bacterium]|nr:MAG: hypothetical protein EON83_18895 [bacterium]
MTQSSVRHSAQSGAPVESVKEGGVTPRVVVLSLLLAVAFGYVIPIIDFKLLNTFLGATHLPPGAVGTLLVLLLVVNPLLRLASKKWAFSRQELLTVYITCLFSCLVPGHGAENLVIPVMIAPFYFATPENKWLDSIQHALKPWMSPALDSHGGLQKSVVDDWYLGLPPGGSIPWSAWIVPIIAWGSLIVAVYAMLGCLSVMVRAQWAEREALAFPLLRLPLQMVEEPSQPATKGFFQNPVMWTGFGVAVFIQMLRGLHLYFPDVPDFPLSLDINALFSEAPWNQMGWIALNTFPIAIGITYLLSSEVGFSLWFFYWFMRFQLVGAYYLGFMPAALPDANYFPNKNFLGFQTGGAFLAYSALVMWGGREHFKHIVQRAFGRTPARAGEEREALSYPRAFWGFTLALVYILGFSIMAGVRWDVALALWVSYLVLAIALTRVAVEGGMLFLLHDIMPLGALSRLLSWSAPWLSTTNSSGVVPASFLQAGIVYHMRGFAMPSFVQGFKLAHDNSIAAKPLLKLIVAVMAVSLGMSFWMIIHMGYDHGTLGMASSWATGHLSVRPATFLESLQRDRGDMAIVSWVALIAGVLLTLGMTAARARFAWFPFHPIGYLISLNFATQMFWFSIFLGWAAKCLITRFGGHESYRKTMPFFLGLVLGDVSMMLFWLIVDGWFGRTGHQLMPN